MSTSITLESSSERLRMALPLMAKYSIPVTPQNYWVWYQHVSGENQPISESISQMMDTEQKIDEAYTSGLYRRYVETADQSHIARAEETIKRVVENASASLNDADNEVSRYEASLEQSIEQLAQQDLKPEQIKSLVESLIASTNRMHEGSSALHANLEESRDEVKSLKEELKRAKAEAKTDPLTGLTNRKGFDESLGEIEASLEDKSVVHTLMICDIDKFKSINDNYGHLFGDKIIKVVAKALKNLTKGKDIAARFGGEEFVVVLPETAIDGGMAVSESIRQHIENGRVFNPKTKEEIRRVTISIGVTEFTFDEPIDAVIERADAALYNAKENGRNRVEVGDRSTAPVAAA